MPETIAPITSVIDPRFQDRERQPGLDLLRAVAIIVVVIYHAGLFGFKLPGRVDRWGWIGVDLFFVLSGYLIGGQLLAPLARNQSINLGRFFARRALRIQAPFGLQELGDTLSLEVLHGDEEAALLFAELFWKQCMAPRAADRSNTGKSRGTDLLDRGDGEKDCLPRRTRRLRLVRGVQPRRQDPRLGEHRRRD